MLNIGVIGCGMVAGYGHLPAIRASADFRLVAVADMDAARAQSAAGGGEARAFTDYRELLGLPGLNAVTIATHMDTHHEIAVEAMRRGLHVLCEKPMASTAAQCEAMVRAAERHGRILAVNFNSRSAGIYHEIKRRIDSGVTGTIRVVRIVYDWSAHHWKPIERMENFMRNGGPATDSAVHFFEAARWFTGQEFTRIEASGVTLPPYDAPQHVIATCTMSGGAVALIEAGWLYCKHTRDQSQLYQMDVIGDDGVVSYDIYSGKLRVYGKETTIETPFDGGDKGFPFVYDRFARSIEAGRVLDLASGHDGMMATRAALDALASAKR